MSRQSLNGEPTSHPPAMYTEMIHNKSIANKSIAIISDNSIVFEALTYNTEYVIQTINSDYISAINKLEKINILILDLILNTNEIPIYRVEYLVNLSGKPIHNQEITLRKPYRLKDLIDIISSNINNEYLFCAINENWIYNERNAKLSSNIMEILFTDKENSIFVELLKSKDFCADKEFLRSKIWNYHQDTESTTLETHLYKLKQKLPDDIFKMNNEKCFLSIKTD